MAQPLKADAQTVVARDDLERQLAGLEGSIAGAEAGIFGPDSVSWRISRESALFLAAGRAALLQLAHPWVAAALDQHSSLLQKPIARFHNTFRIVFTMVFGSQAQAFAASRSLYQLHTRIRGQLPAAVAGYSKDSAYEANQIPALIWVFATLMESAVFAYECVLPPLTQAERDVYYAESRTLAALFGIPAAAMPSDWDSFKAYVDEMCASQALGVNDRSRCMAQTLLAGSGSWIHPPRWYRALTTEWLPERLRNEFGLAFGPAEHAQTRKAKRWLPLVYRRLPPPVRYVGPYHEALTRLAHRKTDFLTRHSNLFWIGEPRLPFGD
jgi:uncharacterized protein (DUF2236 family)